MLQGQRAGYGEPIVATLAKQLEARQGRGCSAKSLRHLLRFAQAFAYPQTVSTLSRQLAWSRFLELNLLPDALARVFFAQMCAQEHWSVRRLRERKDTRLFERTAQFKQPEALLVQALATLRASGELKPALVPKAPLRVGRSGPARTLSGKKTSKTPPPARAGRFSAGVGYCFRFVARRKRIQIDKYDF